MPAIRQFVSIDAPGRTVWRALTTAEGIASWWGEVVRVDARQGGRIVLAHEADGERIEERGMFHSVRPIRDLEIVWDTGSNPVAGTRVQFQVGRGEGETRVHLVHSGGGPLDDVEARAELEAVWKARLKQLRDGIEAA